MSYTIKRLHIVGFRNYENFDLEPDPSLTVLVGPNAVGKTNLIEAVQLVTEARSFRGGSWSEMIRWESQDASVRLDAVDGERVHTVELDITADGRRIYRVNGKPRRTVSEVSGIIPCVLFTPEDLGLIKNSAETRRNLLDGIGTQLSKTYAQLKTEYDRVVKQRNALLRNESVSEDRLAPWDERLVALGSRLVKHRLGLFDRLMQAASVLYGQIAKDGPLTARYVPSWERESREVSGKEPAEALEGLLLETKTDERARKMTLAGPHRDEIVFKLDGRDARTYASQGQQRTVALALKLAEVKVVADISGSRPVLLLDDVMSELDESRRTAFTELVGSTTQTIVTTTNLGYFTKNVIDRAKVVTLA